jgi:eukaryotic-like serine/threonine-protein kinase
MNPDDTASRSEGDPLASTPFRAVAVLGEGSMGIVYEAEHRVLHTRAVVKVLRAACMADPAAAADRLRLEAQAAASLHHNPHIVQVSDLGRTAAGSPYLVMEKLEGRDLRAEVVARGPLPVAEAVSLARQALAGLAAAHAIGVVHRDIKPANLFLCTLPDGERLLKILDFGIAKVLATADRGRAPSPLAKPTLEGVTLGTPLYLSPEQAMGQPVDGRSDVYAMGAVLYWLLTGRAPFRHHQGAFAVMRAHVLEAPAPPSAHAQQPISGALDSTVLRALAKDPSDRFDTAEAFSDELARVVEGAATPGRWPRTERMDTRSFRAAAQGLRGEPVHVLEEAPQRDSTAATLPWSNARGAATEPTPRAGEIAISRPLASPRPAAPEAPGFRAQRHMVLGAFLLAALVFALSVLLRRLASGV